MSREKPPSFQFYPKDFISDEHVAVMTMNERGIYISLICFCWLQGSIPNDVNTAGRMCGANQKEMRSAWPVVSARFQVDPEDASRLRHKRLDIERVKQNEWRSKSSEGGRNSAAKRQANVKGGGKGGNGLVDGLVDICLKPRKEDSKQQTGDGVLEPAVFGKVDSGTISQKLWDIHPSPSESGFVEAAVANEMRNSVHSPEVFASKIVDSLRAWVEYWTSQKRYPIGLKKWVESGDYAKVPPYKATGPAPTHYETPEEREERITREDAARRRG